MDSRLEAFGYFELSEKRDEFCGQPHSCRLELGFGQWNLANDSMDHHVAGVLQMFLDSGSTFKANQPSRRGYFFA
jgi:hypothetical protein